MDLRQGVGFSPRFSAILIGRHLAPLPKRAELGRGQRPISQAPRRLPRKRALHLLPFPSSFCFLFLFRQSSPPAPLAPHWRHQPARRASPVPPRSPGRPPPGRLRLAGRADRRAAGPSLPSCSGCTAGGGLRPRRSGGGAPQAGADGAAEEWPARPGRPAKGPMGKLGKILNRPLKVNTKRMLALENKRNMACTTELNALFSCMGVRDSMHGTKSVASLRPPLQIDLLCARRDAALQICRRRGTL